MRLLGHKCSHVIILNHSHKWGARYIFTPSCIIPDIHIQVQTVSCTITHILKDIPSYEVSYISLTQAPGPIQVIPTVLPSMALLCWGLLLNCHIGSPRPKTTLLLTLGKRIHPNIHAVNLTRFEFRRSGMLPSARNTYQTISSQA